MAASFATFGVGLLPGPKGTWGSLVAVLIGEALFRALGLPALAALAVVSTLLGVPAAGRVEALRRDEDPHEVVVDEVAGQSIALLGLHAFLPAASSGALGAGLVLAAFLLFRLLDVLKPGPVDDLQRLPGGAGIMADDVAAGCLVAAAFGLLALAGLVR
ncbi:phosphatidylglycerophosphatase A [Acidobacteria bacterium ACD]|nr:MAG: phosphatidylglycerophosphatase A [Acidobacteriota bacterium]MCE7958211.1 phosphatidylglycerophosphatase A [Acidobacteria bacterium ACB2]MDL1950045.1 phosphatidylglycerophosphatase A [Acidobacteria bacterium ACD]